MAQQVKDVVLSLRQLGSLMRHRFDPQPRTMDEGSGIRFNSWSRNCHMPWLRPKRGEKKNIKRKSNTDSAGLLAWVYKEHFSIKMSKMQTNLNR